MSSTIGASALARPIDRDMVDTINIDSNINDASHSTDDIAIEMNSTNIDTTLNAVIGMIIISALTGNTILAILGTFLLIIADRITKPDTIITEVTTITDAAIIATNITNSDSVDTLQVHIRSQDFDTPKDLDTITTVGPIEDAPNDIESSVIVVPADSNVHCCHHDRPTFDIIEFAAPTTSPINDTKLMTSDNDSFGGLASDVFNYTAFEKHFKEDKMYFVQTPPSNAAITTGPKAKLVIPLQRDINQAVRFDPKPRKSRSRPRKRICRSTH